MTVVVLLTENGKKTILKTVKNRERKLAIICNIVGVERHIFILFYPFRFDSSSHDVLTYNFSSTPCVLRLLFLFFFWLKRKIIIIIGIYMINKSAYSIGGGQWRDMSSPRKIVWHWIIMLKSVVNKWILYNIFMFVYSITEIYSLGIHDDEYKYLDVLSTFCCNDELIQDRQNSNVLFFDKFCDK